MNNIIAAISCAVIAFVVTAVLGRFLIPALHKLHFGQNIIEDFGPKWHAKKQGTPTMGGLMFIIAIPFAAVAAVLIGKAFSFDVFSNSREIVKFVSSLLLAICFALIGFTDDYIKIVKKRNLGLTEIQKTIPQVGVIAAYLATLILSDNTAMIIPGFGKLALDSVPGKVFFCIFGACVIYGTVNAVNFTDGLDGLCAGVTLPVGVSFAVMAALCKYTSISILGAALAGGCAGYLIWNHYPAKVMMGDTGSMFLGGLIVGLAYSIDCPLIILAVGIIYVIEALSDVIQIGSIKLRHKKVFKMAPIHHHFEMCGWSEKKIDTVFSIVSTIGGALAVFIMYCSTMR
ncbi:MAG: phospho-N-acetylmuramoyl-pentapeptide-transferase [Acutalibacteraceae bacterium]